MVNFDQASLLFATSSLRKGLTLYLRQFHWTGAVFIIIFHTIDPTTDRIAIARALIF
jgi:hypothetical protein